VSVRKPEVFEIDFSDNKSGPTSLADCFNNKKKALFKRLDSTKKEKEKNPPQDTDSAKEPMNAPKRTKQSII